MKMKRILLFAVVLCFLLAACSLPFTPPIKDNPRVSGNSDSKPSETPNTELSSAVSSSVSGVFDPDKAKDYIIDAIDSKKFNAKVNFADFLNDYKNENGVLFLDCTRLYSINVNDARRYLKDTYYLSDEDILSLTIFEDFMPVSEELGQDYKNYGYSEASDLCLKGIPPADPSAQELSISSEDLGYIEVSKDAKISVMDEYTYELKRIGYNEFIEWAAAMLFFDGMPCDIVITNGVITGFTDYSWQG